MAVAAFVAAGAAVSPIQPRVTRAQTREAGAQLLGALVRHSNREGPRPAKVKKA